jgi:hypothetical protein
MAMVHILTILAGQPDCNAQSITCQLQRIADRMPTDNWNTFLSNVLATVIGATFALVGSWALERQRHKSEAARRVNEEAAEYTRRINESFENIFREVGIRKSFLEQHPNVDPIPSAASLYAAASMARIYAKDEDRDATKQLQYATARIDGLPYASDQVRPVELIGQITRAWREGGHDAAKAAERFRGLAPA